MIRIENTEVFGWESAIRGLRNPMNSWDKSDSYWSCEMEPGIDNCEDCEWCAHPEDKHFVIGNNDLKLMINLSKAGNDHSKFLRMINVTCDIVAPLYWWKEFDTYKVGTVRNSCSTMHRIHFKEFTLDDFSHEHLTKDGEMWDWEFSLTMVITAMNHARDLYLKTKDKKYWWQMIQLLPSSYNQRATVQMNYQVLKNIYKSRKGHKLDCWIAFCKWIETLPYAKELICDE